MTDKFSIDGLPDLLRGNLNPQERAAISAQARKQPEFAQALFKFLSENAEAASHHPDLLQALKDRTSQTVTAGQIPVASIAHRRFSASVPLESVAQLMNLSEEEWAARPVEELDTKLTNFVTAFTPTDRPPEAKGYLEKHDLPEGERVAVIGDIHGDGLRLDLTLKALQSRGLLDENFHCTKGSRLVFLGDYLDKGKNNLKVLELLASLKLENPNQVHLLRGNHEDLATSEKKLPEYTKNDPGYKTYRANPEKKELLNSFFESLPVTVYLGASDGTSTQRQYVQYSHGLFHLYTDPAPLLDSRLTSATLWIDGANHYSPRIQQIQLNLPSPSNSPETKRPRMDSANGQKVDKQLKAAQKLNELSARHLNSVQFTDVYWLDASVQSDITGDRKALSIDLIRAYLQVTKTENSAIKEIIRGHQGEVFTLANPKGRTLVTTLDPSADPEMQQFIEMTLGAKVREAPKTWVALPMDSDHEAALADIDVDDASEIIPVRNPPKQ